MTKLKNENTQKLTELKDSSESMNKFWPHKPEVPQCGTDSSHCLWQGRYEHCAGSAGYIFDILFTT